MGVNAMTMTMMMSAASPDPGQWGCGIVLLIAAVAYGAWCWWVSRHGRLR